MHENPLLEMNTHDVAGKRMSGFRVYLERALSHPESLNKFERDFIWLLRMATSDFPGMELAGGEDEKGSSEQYFKMLGTSLREQIKKEISAEQKKAFDRPSVGRAGAFIQQLFFKVLVAGINLEKLKNPNFIENFCSDDNELRIKEQKDVEALMRGAESVYEYFLQLKNEPDVIFIGTSLNLDLAHNIDLMVVRTKSDSSVENPSVDQVDLVEVKSSPPVDYNLDDIHDKHFSFAKAHKESLIRGLNTSEGKHFQESLEYGDREHHKRYLMERFMFINQLIYCLEQDIKVDNWDDVVVLGEKMQIDPILILMRANNMGNFIKNLISPAQFAMIYQFCRKINQIKIPVEVVGMARRLYSRNGIENHTHGVTSWKSIVAYRFFDEWRKSEKTFDEI